MVLLPVIPATSATAERSLIQLCPTAENLSSSHNEPTKTQPFIASAYSPRSYTDNVDLIAVAQDFVAANDYRRNDMFLASFSCNCVYIG